MTVVVVGLVMRRMSRSLRQRATVAEAVAQLGQQALSVTEPDELLKAALTVAVDVLHADYGTALRRLPDGRLKVAAELGPDSLPSGTILQLAPDRSYALHVIESGVPFRVRRPASRSPGVAAATLAWTAAWSAAWPCRWSAPRGRSASWRCTPARCAGSRADDVAVLQAMANVVAIAWEQVEHREQLSHQALHDPLTGLPNRALLLDRLDQALEPAAARLRRPGGRGVDRPGRLQERQRRTRPRRR